MADARERLKHGKALCGKVFAKFVETFNWLVDFSSNIKGDGDAGGCGKIVVDRMDDKHPVIRCKGCDSSSHEQASQSPSAFMISYDGSAYSVENRCFYWDGELKTISSNHVISSSDTAVWLVANQPSPSSSGERPWTFSLSNSQGQAQSGGRVVNYKLYDLDAFEVTCDYRTTFLDMSSPHKVCRFVVEKYDSSTHPSVTLEACTENEAKVEANDGQGQRATLKATGSTAKLEIVGSDDSVTLDPAHLEQGSAQFQTLTVHHADGTDDEYDVLSDSDIDIYEASGEVLTDVEIALSGTTLRLVKTYTDLSDGTTRTENSTGITVREVDVVTQSTYSGHIFQNSKKKVTVLGEQSLSPETVFTAVSHSSHS